MSNIESYIQLLKQFDELPHKRNEITFMEICKYPYSRFEEVCSRVLQFYFNPVAEHGLRSLLLQSLFEVPQLDNILCDYCQIRVETEVYADGKRIDLIIETPDSVVCIENKMMASVYNPLDIYRRDCICKYKDKQLIFLILSAKRITDPNELKHIHQNGFKIITYTDFFEVVKRNIGGYLTFCNQKYLTYLLDFIKTVENMTYRIEPNSEDSFFFENKKEIDQLINQYQDYKNTILSIQKEQISILKTKITQLTNVEWWDWQGWDLGISFNDKGHRIGIESSYQATKDNPIGVFKIYITTWEKKDWYPYRDKLMEQYAGLYLDENVDGGRVFLHIDAINDNNMDLILKKLSECYKVVQRLASEVS